MCLYHLWQWKNKKNKSWIAKIKPIFHSAAEFWYLCTQSWFDESKNLIPTIEKFAFIIYDNEKIQKIKMNRKDTIFIDI